MDDTPATPPPGLEPVVRRFDHVSMAVRDIRSALPTLRLVDAAYLNGGTNPRTGMRWAQFRLPGGTRLELIAPLDRDDPGNFLVRFLDRRGEGLHHLTFRVDDLHRAIAAARAAGYRVVDVDDEGDWKEAFIHPGSAHGVLIQFAQWDKDDPPVTLDELLGEHEGPA